MDFGVKILKIKVWIRNQDPWDAICTLFRENGQLWIFVLNLGKFPNYVQNFGSNIVECVAEGWVEAEMSWVEVDGAGWRWVHGLVIISSKIIRLISDLIL